MSGNQSEKNYRLEFDPNEKNRDTFLRTCIDALENFVPSEIPKLHGFIMLVREIVKNNHDHAGGRGYMELTQVSDGIQFEIGDYGSQSFNLSEIIATGSSRLSSGRNFGVGICQNGIVDMASTLCRDFSVDTSKGFCYRGVFILE